MNRLNPHDNFMFAVLFVHLIQIVIIIAWIIHWFNNKHYSIFYKYVIDEGGVLKERTSFFTLNSYYAYKNSYDKNYSQLNNQNDDDDEQNTYDSPIEDEEKDNKKKKKLLK